MSRFAVERLWSRRSVDASRLLGIELELRKRCPEGVGHLEKDAVRRLALAALDTGEVGAIDASEVGQTLLGDFERGAALADRTAECEVAWGADGWHVGSVPACCLSVYGLRYNGLRCTSWRKRSRMPC